eukprot:Gb_07753 [translate_table: standard]
MEFFGKMAKSVATTRGAPTHAHLHAIRDRNRDQNERPELGGNGDNDSQIELNDQRIENNRRQYLKNVSSHDSRMKAPKIHDSLSWKNKKNDHTVRPEDAELIRTATSSANKYKNDGSLFWEIAKHQNKEQKNSSLFADFENKRDLGEGPQIFELQTGDFHVKITNWGVTIMSLSIPGPECHLADVVLIFDTVTPYMKSSTHRPQFRAMVGRIANRIKNAHGLRCCIWSEGSQTICCIWSE